MLFIDGPFSLQGCKCPSTPFPACGMLGIVAAHRKFIICQASPKHQPHFRIRPGCQDTMLKAKMHLISSYPRSLQALLTRQSQHGFNQHYYSQMCDVSQSLKHEILSQSMATCFTQGISRWLCFFLLLRHEAFSNSPADISIFQTKLYTRPKLSR